MAKIKTGTPFQWFWLAFYAGVQPDPQGTECFSLAIHIHQLNTVFLQPDQATAQDCLAQLYLPKQHGLF